jgi:hypothetical protein
VTVGTPISPATIERKLKPVKTVNGIGADENGNVNIEVGGGGNVPTKVSELENDAGYITEQALNGYAKTADIPTVPSKVSAFENDKGYLTEHQDLSGYAKTTDIPSLEGYAKTADIPTDAHINDLINAALGVIENGSY